jgi:hypothetical protein
MSDETALAEYGHATIEFREDGFLKYTIHGYETDEVILLSYRIDGNQLITDQPSKPKTERTEFSFSDDGLLLLYFDGVPSLYRRVDLPS